MRTGLVLTGGGARAAYQAGAIKALYEIAKSMGIDQPFQVMTGTSAGAINVSYLAANIDNAQMAVENLAHLWSGVRTNKIFKADTLSLLRIVFETVLGLATGRILATNKTPSLLDNSPLRILIEREIDFKKLHRNIQSGLLDSLALEMMNYSNGTSFTFFQSAKEVKIWERASRKSCPAEILSDHVMASLGIPILFPPVRIGDDYFGDGSLRNYTPLSPAIKLGAEKILIIAVRGVKQNADEKQTTPSLGRVAGLALNSVLLDAVDIDYERLSRINETVGKLRPGSETPLKPIDVFMIRPTLDVGRLAAKEEHEFPWAIRYLLRGLGDPRESADLISYLLFESSFTTKLVALGYKDVMDKAQDIRNFFSSDATQASSKPEKKNIA